MEKAKNVPKKGRTDRGKELENETRFEEEPEENRRTREEDSEEKDY